VHVSSQQEVDEMVAELSKAGAMRNTTVVSAAEGCGVGERYAALCSALSMGERVRDQGGHSFVVLDDISCMVRPFLDDISCMVRPFLDDISCMVRPFLDDISCMVRPVLDDISCMVRPVLDDISCMVKSFQWLSSSHLCSCNALVST